jgi:hypothetical protein
VRKDLPRFCGRQIAVTVAPQVAEQLLSTEKEALRRLGEQLGRQIEVRARPGLHQEQFEVTALDSGPPVSIPLRWLEAPKPSADDEPEEVEFDEETEAPRLESPEGEAAVHPSDSLDGEGESRILPALPRPEEP